MDAISTCESRASGNSAIGASIWSSWAAVNGGGSAARAGAPVSRHATTKAAAAPGRRERRGRNGRTAASERMIVSLGPLARGKSGVASRAYRIGMPTPIETPP